MASYGVRRLAVLIDLNGTLHVDREVVPGCIEALERLQKNDRIDFKFVTNTTIESSTKLQERLADLLGKTGIGFSSSKIFTSLSAARNKVIKQSLRPMLLLEKEALSDFEDINQTNPNAVVVGLAPSQFNYETLNRAFRLLLSGENVKLIAIHMGRFYSKKDGLTMGPGPFVKALQYATEAQVEVVGKPERAFFHSALESMNGSFAPADAVMVGDDVHDDVIGAINAGMHGILVKTGKYRQGDELQIRECSRNCVENFAAAVDLIEQSLDNPALLKLDYKKQLEYNNSYMAKARNHRLIEHGKQSSVKRDSFVVMFYNRYGAYGQRTLDNTMLFRFFLEFIKSSMWTLPIATFIEQKSLVFDREQEDPVLYKKIHKEFVSLVDALMECFCDDLHVKAEQLVASMKENHFKAEMTVKGRVLLEPVAAAQDYEVFVSMMMRKNIELQLQAIHMIEVICGLVPAVLRIGTQERSLEDLEDLTIHGSRNEEDIKRLEVTATVVRKAEKTSFEKKQKHAQEFASVKSESKIESSEKQKHLYIEAQKKKMEEQKKEEMKAWDDTVKNLQIDPNEYENTILLQVLKESKKDFETDPVQRKEILDELERARKETAAEKERLEISRENEEIMFREALRKNINATLEDDLARRRRIKKKSDDKSTKEAGSITLDKNSSKSSKTVAEINALLEEPKRIGTADIEERKEYLRKQRDKLLALKKIAREKQFRAATNNAKTKAERPKTAQAAEEAMAGTLPQPTYISEKILAARHEMALKLKNNLLMTQETP